MLTQEAQGRKCSCQDLTYAAVVYNARGLTRHMAEQEAETLPG